jgi:hypothetical protein
MLAARVDRGVATIARRDTRDFFLYHTEQLEAQVSGGGYIKKKGGPHMCSWQGVEALALFRPANTRASSRRRNVLSNVRLAAQQHRPPARSTHFHPA